MTGEKKSGGWFGTHLRTLPYFPSIMKDKLYVEALNAMFQGYPFKLWSLRTLFKILIHILLLIIYQISKAVYSTMHSFAVHSY